MVSFHPFLTIGAIKIVRVLEKSSIVESDRHFFVPIFLFTHIFFCAMFSNACVYEFDYVPITRSAGVYTGRGLSFPAWPRLTSCGWHFHTVRELSFQDAFAERSDG